MRVARLTNLGNLTLKNLSELDKEYQENAQLKREKLRKLWHGDDMETFQRVFLSYHSATPKPFVLQDKQSVYDVAIERFSQLGLVRIEDRAGSLDSIVEDIERDEYMNPAKNIHTTIVELTGLCNLKCEHCYRGGSREGEYGLPVEKIKQALEPLIRAGIKHITFTGGEPTLRKDDLIDIIDYASKFMELIGVSTEERLQYRYGKPNPTVEDVLQTEYYIKLREQLIEQLALPESELHVGDWNICNKNTPEDVEEMLRGQAKSSIELCKSHSTFDIDGIGILTNAYFEDQREFVRRLKSYGNVDIQTSLDSFDEKTTDLNRGRKGVFAHVKSLVQISEEEDFPVWIVGHDLGNNNSKRAKENEEYFGGRTKVFDGMLQLGNAIQNSFKTRDSRWSSNNRIGDLSSTKEPRRGWCTAWTSPEDIHIRPNGNVGNCLYAYAVPEEFGNLYTQKMEDILNGIQDSRVYQMFRDGTIERCQHELDKSIFDRKYSGSCELIALTLTYAVIKENLIRDGVLNPIARANEEVARIYKFTGGEGK